MFDPYHKWLGIPKDQRPPTHYQLLGVSPNEDDLEVIEEAAIRQTTHVRAYQMGPHAADCTRLLNEISQAKLVLLDPAKRKQYDETLAKQKPAQAVASRAAPAADPLQDLRGLDTGPLDRRRPGAANPAGARGDSSSLVLPLAIGGGVAALALVAGVIVLIVVLSNSGTPTTPGNDTVVLNPNNQEKDKQPKNNDGQKQKKQDDKVKKEKKDGKDKEEVKEVKKDREVKKDKEVKKQPDPVVVGDPRGEWRVDKTAFTVAATPNPNRVLLGGSTIRSLDLITKEERVFGERRTGAIKASFAVCKDGESFYAAYMDDPVIYHWNLNTGEELGQLKGHTAPIAQVLLTPDGKFLLSCGNDKTVRLWNTATREEVAALADHNASVVAIAVSPDGRRAVSASSNKLILWDLEQRKPLVTGFTKLPRGIAFSPDGQSVVTSGLFSEGLQILDAATLKQTNFLPGKGLYLGRPMFTPDGRHLLVEGGQGQVTLLEWPAAKLLGTFPAHEQAIQSMALTPDGRYLFTRGRPNDALKRWALADVKIAAALPPVEKQPVEKLPVEKQPVEVLGVPVTQPLLSVALRGQLAVKVAPTADPTRLLLAGGNFMMVELAAVKDPPVPNIIAIYGQGKPGGIHPTVVPSPDGEHFFGTVLGDPDILFYNQKTKQVVDRLKGHTEYVTQLVMTPDRKYLVSSSRDKTVRLWDAATRKELAVLTGHTFLISNLAVSPDGRRAVSSCPSKLILWDLKARKALTSVAVGPVGPLQALAFSPDGSTILSTGRKDDQLTLYDGRTLAPRGRKAGPEALGGSLLFTPNGKHLIAQGQEGRLHLLEWPALKLVTVFETKTKFITDIAFSADGAFLYGLSLENTTLRKWPLPVDVAVRPPDEKKGAVVERISPDEVRRFGNQVTPVTALALAPDGKNLYCGDHKGMFRTWNLDTGKTVEYFSVGLPVHSLDISADRKYIAVCSDAAVRVLVDGKAVGPNLPAAPGAFWLKPGLLFRVGDGKFQTHGYHGKNEGGGSGPFQQPVKGVAAAPQRDWFVTWGERGVHLHQAFPGGGMLTKAQLSAEEATCAAFSPDNRLLAVAGKDMMVRVFDVAGGKEVKNLTGHQGIVRCLAFSPDGQRLLSGGDDKTLRVWDVAAGKELRRFVEQDGAVLAVVCTPDGRHAYAASADKFIRHWRLPQ